MPPVGKIERLKGEAPDLYEELNRRLVGCAFGNSVGLSEWLSANGYEIGKTTVNEHAQWLRAEYERAHQKRLLRIELAKAVRGMSDDDKVALMESTEMMALDQIQEEFETWADLDRPSRLKALPALVKGLAKLNESAIGTARYRKEFEAEIRRQALEEAAKVADAAAKAEGVSEATRDKIRAALGMSV
jgi:hypothetical protein